MKIKKSYEYIIIGSGFGGSLAAYNLAKAGKEVLVIERGQWARRDDTCWDEKKLHLDNPLYRGHTPVLIDKKNGKYVETWTDDTVGGMSTFYGAAAFRMREDDFFGTPLPGTDKRDKTNAWPFDYYTLEPYYDEAERLQGVAGIEGEDFTEPHRANGYPQNLPERLSLSSNKVRDAALELGLHPFHIPLAINFSGKFGKAKCILCSTCDHYICKIEGKNDLSVVILPDAIKNGATVLANKRAVKINISNREATSVNIVDQTTGETATIKTKKLIVACGAISTPHLLLASGIDSLTDNKSPIGRLLMFHTNGSVSGVFPYKTNPDKMFQKQIAIPDFYYGSSNKKKKSSPPGNWGIIQDIQTPGRGITKKYSPWGLKNIASLLPEYLINLICIAEDIPQYNNRVFVDWDKKDIFGMPSLKIYHRYHRRDIDARNALYKESKKILRRAGAKLFYIFPIETLSHAFGSCRFGQNIASSVLDPDCKVWGSKNIYVLDASFMPSVGSINPSLTIAANSLRVSKMLVQ